MSARASGSLARITWAIATSGEEGVPSEFEFTAGLVMTANRFPKGEIFASLETRVPVVRFEVSGEDVFSFMRKISREGHRVFDGGSRRSESLSADECEAVIAHLERRGATDLRKLHHALALYARHREGERWRGLLDTILASSASVKATAPLRGPRPNEEVARRREDRILRELLGAGDLTTAERVERFQARTGRSRPTFFRRQRELQERGE